MFTHAKSCRNLVAIYEFILSDKEMKIKIIVVQLLFIMYGVAHAQELIDGLYYRLNVNKGEAKISASPVSPYSYSGAICIKPEVEYQGTKFKVVGVDGSAFYKCTSLTSVEIPSSVKVIDLCAFYGCSGLTSIDIPNSVTKIKDSAFYMCENITSVTIPDSVIEIGKEAFAFCANLKSLFISDSVKKIGSSSFWDCESLQSVVLPDLLTEIESSCFAHCHNLSEINIPNSVKSIWQYAFCNCKSLTSITLPASVKEIWPYAFYGCEKLGEVTCLSETPPSIYPDTFNKYDKLYVPQGCKSEYMNAPYWKDFKAIEEIPLHKQ